MRRGMTHAWTNDWTCEGICQKIDAKKTTLGIDERMHGHSKS